MFKRFWRYLFPVKTVFLEVPLDETPGNREQVKHLASHDGFLWLMWKLRCQRRLLSAELETRLTHEEDLSLKAGIYWLRFMERSLQMELTRSTRTRENPEVVSDEITKQIFAALRGVGEDAPQAQSHKDTN